MAPQALLRPTGCLGPSTQAPEPAMKCKAEGSGQHGDPAASGAPCQAILGRTATDGWMPIRPRRRLTFLLHLQTARWGSETAALEAETAAATWARPSRPSGPSVGHTPCAQPTSRRPSSVFPAVCVPVYGRHALSISPDTWDSCFPLADCQHTAHHCCLRSDCTTVELQGKTSMAFRRQLATPSKSD